MEIRVLPVKAVLDAAVAVDLVEYTVRVVLHRRREDDELVLLRHLLDELDAARSYEEVALRAHIEIVHKCLIEVEHECVRFIGLLWWQERFLHLRQLLVK